MKVKFYLVFVLLFCGTLVCLHATAQYHITGHTFGGNCANLNVQITTDVPPLDSQLLVKQFWGDGTILTTHIGGYLDPGIVNFSKAYSNGGNYTMKSVLIDNGNDIDSAIYSWSNITCKVMNVILYNDANHDCSFGGADAISAQSAIVEIDSNGIPIDTLSTIGGFYYATYGNIGDIFSYKVITAPAGLELECPVIGVVSDTINASANYPIKYIGFQCINGVSMDLSINAVGNVTGVNDQWKNIYINNAACTPTNAIVTVNFSSKYHANIQGTHPAATSMTPTSYTWDLNSFSGNDGSPIDLYYAVWTNGNTAVGDTVVSYFTVTPTAGDANPSNNQLIIIDTIRGGCDPNEMWVSPVGNILAGTQLTYTTMFENTGTDTTYNIYVMDTLSDNVDVKSLSLVSASAVMNAQILQSNGHNIIKFDFPNINLLDSSHHGKAEGTVIFKVNTKTGLANGTKIDNHAGIFFDYNPVVMTNVVENVIGFPAAVATIPNDGITLYPNPANDVIIITTGNSSYTSLQVSNTLGQSFMQQPISGQKTQVDVHQLPAGMYYITMIGDSKVTVKKFEKL